MPSTKEIKTIFSILEKNHHLTMLEELGHYSPFQMLVMTMLSSRTKDSTTIPLVKELFARYPSPQDLINLDLKIIEKLIYGIGFFKVKARHIQQLSQIILNKYQGKVQLILKPWLNNWWRVLPFGGWHAPIIFVGNKIISQGVIVDKKKLIKEIEKRLGNN